MAHAPEPTVLVVDDHALINTTLVLALRTEGLEAHRCEDTDPEAVLRDAEAHVPGLVLLDLDLGRNKDGLAIDGAALVAPLCARGWTVLVLTGTRDPARIGSAVAAGAMGWVDKTESFDKLVRAALDVLEGRSIVSAAERAAMLARHRQRESEESAALTKLSRLTSRERDVLRRLAAGKKAAAIATEFVTSVATVRAQIRSILTKLEVGSQLAAVALANEHQHALAKGANGQAGTAGASGM